MRYTNTKTGAIVDSSFKIVGENWEEVKPKRKEPDKKTETEKKE